MDPDVDLNRLLNKYSDVDEQNPDEILDICSPYVDVCDIDYKMLKSTNNHNSESCYTSLHINIQSLPAKFDRLKILIHELLENNIEIDFILLCETFLTDSTQHHFNMPGYNLICRNRPNTNRGGVAIYIKNKYNVTMREDIAINIPGVFESIFVEIISDNFKCIVGEIYRVPNTNEANSLNYFERVITKLSNSTNDVIIATDQNFDYLKAESHKNSHELLDMFLTNGLLPTITKPTRITHTSATLIDNIYVSTKQIPCMKSAILTYEISDHFPIIACVETKQKTNKREPKTIEKRQMTQLAISRIADRINTIDWKYLEHYDINEAYANFSKSLDQIINDEAPIKQIIIPASWVIRDPWMSPELVAASRKLNKLYKMKIGKDKTDPAFIKFDKYKKTFNRLKRKVKFNYYDELLQNYQHNIKKTWGVINSIIGRSNDKSSISDTFKISNKAVTNPSVIANEFCTFFTNIGIKYANEIQPSKVPFDNYMKNKSERNMFLSPTDPTEICKLIDSLKNKHSCGHDGISSVLLKSVKHEIAVPLTLLINKSLSCGEVPDQMKLAKIIPIYKSKDKQLLNNYRPISLLPTTSKILEKVVHKRLYKFINSQSLFYKSQYGFRPNHSTIHAVNEFTDDVITSFENKHNTLGVFLDLSKAFDTIDHKILIRKLEWNGIRGRALEWFKSYLSNRKQYVQYRNSKSTTLTMSCGVPQGSVLGPLLFIIYTNDLPNSLSRSKAILFADDTTIYLSSDDITTVFDHVNHDLEHLADWFRANKLSLNIGKTNCVVFNLNNNHQYQNLRLKIGHDVIETKSVVKFLGIYIDKKLQWHDHINFIRTKLNSSLYAMNRVKNTLSTSHLLTLYYSLVYPYINYGISLWGSSHTSYMHKLFITQKKAVRIIKRVKYNEHTSPLFKELKLLKLNDVHRLQVAKYMHNMTQGILPSPLSNQIQLNINLHPYNTRNQNNPHFTHRRTNLASQSIRHKGPSIWYSIQESIRSKKTVKTFQAHLKKLIFTSY